MTVASGRRRGQSLAQRRARADLEPEREHAVMLSRGEKEGDFFSKEEGEEERRGRREGERRDEGIVGRSGGRGRKKVEVDGGWTPDYTNEDTQKSTHEGDRDGGKKRPPADQA